MGRMLVSASKILSTFTTHQLIISSAETRMGYKKPAPTRATHVVVCSQAKLRKISVEREHPANVTTGCLIDMHGLESRHNSPMLARLTYHSYPDNSFLIEMVHSVLGLNCIQKNRLKHSMLSRVGNSPSKPLTVRVEPYNESTHESSRRTPSTRCPTSP